MKRSRKTSLIIIALALLACFVVFFVVRPGSDEPDAERMLDTSRGPSFEMRVVVPRTGLPFAGILPDWLAKKHDLTPRELRLDHTSPGAKIGRVGQDRLELRAEGDWNLLIETDGEGRVRPGTHLVFPTGLGGTQMKLRCRPADPAIGNLRTTTRSGTGLSGGSFMVELAKCENADSGKATDWPPAPLTVRGSFVGPATTLSPER